MKNIQELIDLITLEEIDKNLFIGQSFVTPWRRVFGGQVLGQALNAVYRTVPEDRIVHSLHGYFILAGEVDKPIVYQVQTLRDGGSFTTRRVTAMQNGKAIFIMAASFQLAQEGFDHQMSKPDVPEPETLITDMQQAEMIKDIAPDLYLKMKGRDQNAIEFRPVEKLSFLDADEDKAIRNVWMKMTSEVDIPLPMQHQLLAYASDYDLLLTSLAPHRSAVMNKKIFVASLDHAMWFHRDFDFNDWLLFVIDSPSASNSRGMGHGKIFDRKGRLVSTVMQEGLVRIKR